MLGAWRRSGQQRSLVRLLLRLPYPVLLSGLRVVLLVLVCEALK